MIHFHRLGQMFTSKFSFQRPLLCWLSFLLISMFHIHTWLSVWLLRNMISVWLIHHCIVIAGYRRRAPVSRATTSQQTVHPWIALYRSQKPFCCQPAVECWRTSIRRWCLLHIGHVLLLCCAEVAEVGDQMNFEPGRIPCLRRRESVVMLRKLDNQTDAVDADKFRIMADFGIASSD